MIIFDLLLYSLFHFFYFLFSALISFSLFSSFSIFFFLIFFLKPLSSLVEKLLYTYTYIICIIYIFLENLWIFAY